MDDIEAHDPRLATADAEFKLSYDFADALVGKTVAA